MGGGFGVFLFLVLYIGCAIVCGGILKSKGRHPLDGIGWGLLTFIGIFVCMVMPDKKESSGNINIGVADEIAKYKDLMDRGVITKEDFEKIKKKLIG